MDERHDRHEQRQTPNHGEEEVDSWAENSEEWKKNNNTNTLGISKLKKSAALNDLFSLPYVNDDGNLSTLNRSLKPKP